MPLKTVLRCTRSHPDLTCSTGKLFFLLMALTLFWVATCISGSGTEKGSGATDDEDEDDKDDDDDEEEGWMTVGIRMSLDWSQEISSEKEGEAGGLRSFPP